MLFCPKCQQLEPTTQQRKDDGSVTYLCKKCGGVMPLRRDLRPGEVVAGFEIQEELGRGAMGIVYQARQTNLDREVAIKILSDDSASDEVYVERFFREARAAASLSHPNVVQAYDAGVTEDGIYYFVMEKVTGENLDLVLNNVGPLNVPQALDVFLSVANALSYAWTRNQLSHGDIKPENIIMRLNGKVKLADFGLARRAKDPELADEDIRATPAYAPPEIIRGDKDVPGFKSDMYSFGATAYHVLIGHEPFIDSDPMKVCSMQVSDTQTPLVELNPNIPKRLSALVDALMQKDPAKRPATWNDVVEELKAIQSELLAEPARSSKPEAKGKTHPVRFRFQQEKKQIPIVVIVVVAAVFLLVLLFIVFRKKGETPQMPDNPPRHEQTPVSTNPSSGPAGKPGRAQARDKAYYQARWKMILADSGELSPGLELVENFIAEAGDNAPAEAVEILEKLRAGQEQGQGSESAQSRALMLRNDLLDQAATFREAEVEKLDFDQLDTLLLSVQSKLAELTRLDDSLEEHIFLPEQKKTIEAYVKRIANLQLARSLGGDVLTEIDPGTQAATEEKPAENDNKSTPVAGPDTPANNAAADADTPANNAAADADTPANNAAADADTPANNAAADADTPANNAVADADTPANNATEPEEDPKQLLNYLLLLDCLPDTIAKESERAAALGMLNDLLSDSSFADPAKRRNCIDVRKFLVLNQMPLLPYLVADKTALKGIKLFPVTYPNSVLEDIADNTFRLKEVDERANITQRVAWNKIRKEEGEDLIVVTLINSPQLAKLSEEFREYLFARALFLGVDPEALKKRYDRASGLSAEKRNDLSRIAGFFRREAEQTDDY